MPIHFSVVEDLDLVYLNLRGAASTQQLLDCIERYAQAPGFHSRIDLLIDLRGMAEYELGEDDVIERVNEVIQTTRNGETGYRAAYIVQSAEEETLVSMSNDLMYRAEEAEAFYESAEALRWLGRSDAEERIAELHRAMEEKDPPAGIA